MQREDGRVVLDTGEDAVAILLQSVKNQTVVPLIA